jgi:hypothetical protein
LTNADAAYDIVQVGAAPAPLGWLYHQVLALRETKVGKANPAYRHLAVGRRFAPLVALELTDTGVDVNRPV